MDYKEAKEFIDTCYSAIPNHFDELLSFIKSQDERLARFSGDLGVMDKKNNELHDRLSELEEDCPDCKGDGFVDDILGFNKHGSPIKNCETCKGSGKIPICYLPEWFVIMLGEASDIVSHYAEFSFKNESGDKVSWGNIDNLNTIIVDFAYAGYVFKLTKQPNSLWKLEKSNKESL